MAAKDSGDLQTQAAAYVQLAENDLYSIDNDDRAIKNYINAIDIYRKLGDSIRFYEVKADLGRLYAEQEYYEEALNYLNNVLAFQASLKDTMAIGRLLNQIGDIYLAKGEIDNAVEYLKRSKAMNIIVQDTFLALINRITLATITESGEGIEEFSDSTLHAFSERDTTTDPGFKSSAMLNAGLYYLQQKKYPMALYYFNKSKEAGVRNPHRLRNAYKHLAACYQEIGDFEKAFFNLEKYTTLNDSLLNARRIRIINHLLINEKYKAKEAQVIDLQKDKLIASMSNRAQRIITFSLLFGSIIILFGAYLTIRLYQQRLHTNQIISAQKEQLIQSRVTDLENSLKIETMHSMLQGQEEERERIAKDLHDSLGGLLSTIKLHFDSVQFMSKDIEENEQYQKAHQLLDEACKEVRNISNNMQPGALLKLGIVPAIKDLVNRIQGESTPEIELQHYGDFKDLDQTISLNIYRIIQELLINSVKHANAKEILVQLLEKDNELTVMVEDDGIGYRVEEVEKGMGTGNIASRVKYLKGEISIDSEIGRGTTTIIAIPVVDHSIASSAQS
jgi:signal transduction histidine kinase